MAPPAAQTQPRRPDPASLPDAPRVERRPAADRHLWEITPVRDVLWMVTAIGIVWFLYALRGVFAPVLVALTLAYIVNPLVRRAETRWKVPRPATATAILILVGIAGAALIAWLGPLVTEQIRTFANKAPSYLQSLSERYQIPLNSVSEPFTTFVTRLQEDPLSVLQPLFLGTSQAVGVIGQVIGTTTQVALWVLLIPIYFFFFSWYFDRLLATMWRWWPASRKPAAARILGRMDTAVSGFFRGRVVIGILTAIMYAVGWAMADVPYWFLLGVMTGILTIVPYVSAIGWPLAILLKYLDVLTGGEGEGFSWMAVVFWPSMPYLIVQFIESWLLTPWIQSQSTDISAVTVLIVVFLGGAIGGISGLLLAIPVAACLKILSQELLVPRWERWAAEH